MPEVMHPELEKPVQVSDKELADLRQMDDRWTVMTSSGWWAADERPSKKPAESPKPAPGGDDYESLMNAAIADADAARSDQGDYVAPPAEESSWTDKGMAALTGVQDAFLGPGFSEMWGGGADYVGKLAKEHLGTDLGIGTGNQEYIRELQEEHPYYKGAAEFVGGFHPLSIGGRLGAIFAPAKAAGSVGEAVYGAMRGGAAEGTAEGTVGGLMRQATEYADPNATEEERDFDPMAVANEAAAGWLYGLGFGTVFGAGAHGVKRLGESRYNKLRAGTEGMGPEIRRLENAGVETRVLGSGFKEPEWLAPLKTREGLHGEFEDVAQQIEHGSVVRDEGIAGRHAQDQEDFLQSPEGRSRPSVAALNETARALQQRQRTAFEGPPSQVLQKFRENTEDPHLIGDYLTDAAHADGNGNAEESNALIGKAKNILRANTVMMELPNTDMPEGAYRLTPRQAAVLGIGQDDLDRAVNETLAWKGEKPERVPNLVSMLGNLATDFLHAVRGTKPEARSAAPVELKRLPGIEVSSVEPTVEGDPLAPLRAAVEKVQAERGVPETKGQRIMQKLQGDKVILDEPVLLDLPISSVEMRDGRVIHPGGLPERPGSARGQDVIAPAPRAPAKGGGVNARPRNVALLVVPKGMGLAELETNIAAAKKIAGIKDVSGRYDEDAKQMLMAMYDFREKFGGPTGVKVGIPSARKAVTGYAAEQKLRSMELKDEEHMRAAAGIPTKLKEKMQVSIGGEPTEQYRRVEFGPGERDKLGAAIATYDRWAPEVLAEHDQALRLFLDAAGGDPQRLQRLAAAIAYGNIKNAATPKMKALMSKAGVSSYATGISEALAIRSDPAFRQLMKARGGGAAAGRAANIDPVAEFARDRILEMLDDEQQ